MKEKKEEKVESKISEEEILNLLNQNNLNQNSDIWILLLLLLLFSNRQEQPIININLGDGKNVQ